jgi:hypothetical protein
MQVDNPMYDINETTDFNINFMKKDETGLTLSQAKKTFVQLSGFNVIYAYNFLKSLLYSENTIACNIVQTQRLVANEIVCSSIKSEVKRQTNQSACSIFFDNLTIYLSSNPSKISIFGKNTTIENLSIPNSFKIIVQPKHYVVIYDNKRIVEKIKSHEIQYFKQINIKNGFTHISVKPY